MVSPKITAQCGKQVTLNCNTTLSHQGLSIKLMQWFQGETILCFVDSKGKIITHQRGSLSDFSCEYEDGRLSVIFKTLQPLESGKNYTCKQRSNKGALSKSTKVELQGQSPAIYSYLTLILQRNIDLCALCC